VLIRVRNARGDDNYARAFAALERDAIAALEDYDVPAP
jgi:hypothetical protein